MWVGCLCRSGLGSVGVRVWVGLSCFTRFAAGLVLVLDFSNFLSCNVLGVVGVS